MSPAAPPVQRPTPPVTIQQCPHCDGVGWVDDDTYEPGFGHVAREFMCDRCDGLGVGPVDADGYCACMDCTGLPTDQRVGEPVPDPTEPAYPLQERP